MVIAHWKVIFRLLQILLKKLRYLYWLRSYCPCNQGHGNQFGCKQFFDFQSTKNPQKCFLNEALWPRLVANPPGGFRSDTTLQGGFRGANSGGPASSERPQPPLADVWSKGGGMILWSKKNPLIKCLLHHYGSPYQVTYCTLCLFYVAS